MNVLIPAASILNAQIRQEVIHVDARRGTLVTHTYQQAAMVSVYYYTIFQLFLYFNPFRTGMMYTLSMLCVNF